MSSAECFSTGVDWYQIMHSYCGVGNDIFYYTAMLKRKMHFSRYNRIEYITVQYYTYVSRINQHIQSINE